MNQKQSMNQIRRLHAAITAAILGAALTSAGAAPASAATIDVRPGGSVQAAIDQAEPAPASDAPSSPPATSGNRSGLPFLSGVFAHNLPRIERYEQVTGRPVDLWQIAPQREQGDDTMVSETQRTLAEVPAGVAVDYAVPIEGAGMGAGMGARLGSVLAAKTDAPVYVRPGWEFNLQGSWAWTTDRIGDAAFIDGFRATVDGLRSTCPQCIIVWNPNTGQGGIDKAMQAWPGDAYVQVVGVDAYDWGNEDPMDGPGQLNEWAAKARELGKQISLPEWGVHGKDGRGDNPAFVNDVLAWADRNRDIVAYLSYFDEPADYIVNSVGDGQMPKTGEALRAGFERLASSPGAVSAQPATGAPQPAPTQAPDAAPTDSVSDVRDQEWTDPAGSTSTYHLLNAAGARGLVVYLDGDGSHGYDNLGDGYALGGPEGVAAKAAAKGYATLAVRPVGGAETFWGDGPANAAYVAALTDNVTAQGGFSDVAVIGYSGGSQLATKWLIPQHPDLASLVVVTGGGGAPDQVPSPVAGTRLVWHTGADDDGRGTTDGYNAISDAKAGAAAYRAAGWDVTEAHPAGQAHDLAGQFGDILDAHLTAPVSAPTGTAPPAQSGTAPAWPGPTEPTPPAPAPAPDPAPKATASAPAWPAPAEAPTVTAPPAKPAPATTGQASSPWSFAGWLLYADPEQQTGSFAPSMFGGTAPGTTQASSSPWWALTPLNFLFGGPTQLAPEATNPAPAAPEAPAPETATAPEATGTPEPVSVADLIPSGTATSTTALPEGDAGEDTASAPAATETTTK